MPAAPRSARSRFGGRTSTGTPQGPFGFAAASGYQEDGDSGLKLLAHRYYDPSTGRFLTRDPAKDGRNWYAYCEENPLKGIDTDGLQVQVPPAPPRVSVRHNINRIHRIQQHTGSSGIAFANLVREGGEWDYKKYGSQYEDFGNFHYGVIAASMGYDEDTALRMAGGVQILTGHSRPEWGYPWDDEGPFGDDPHDQHEIKEGYRYYREVIRKRQ